ncbi:MAG: hypothetical protein ACOCUS_01605, partial [Polyangiales bacterium]
RETCAMCHVSELSSGEVWLGPPNRELDVGRFKIAVNDRWMAAGNESLLTELQIEKLGKLGPGRIDAATSSYPEAVPADFPPYFGLADRSHYNYLGTGRDLRSEVYLSVFSAGAGSPNEEEAIVPFPPEEEVQAMVDFMGSLEPPPPPMLDTALVERGRDVFEAARCASCHHPHDRSSNEVVTLDREPDGAERLPGEHEDFPRGSIRTSPQHSIIQETGSDMDRGYEDLIMFILDKRLQVGMTDGYRTNYLGGLAYTAPYLHNGSVPTLADLLEPADERPTTFMRGDFEVDTTKRGNGNEGHEFGVDLPGADKEALVAYLKSL